MGAYKLSCFAISTVLLVIALGIFTSHLTADRGRYGSWTEVIVKSAPWQRSSAHTFSTHISSNLEARSLANLLAAQQRITALLKENEELLTLLSAKNHELLHEQHKLDEEEERLHNLEQTWGLSRNETEVRGSQSSALTNLRTLERARARSPAEATQLSSAKPEPSPSPASAPSPSGEGVPGEPCEPEWESKRMKLASGLLDWTPAPHRYLAAFCWTGQMSNRILCMKKYMAFAALLNRTVILPRTWNDGWHYDFDWVVDRDHFRRCLGNHTIVSVEEYLAVEGKQEMAVNYLCLWNKVCDKNACRKAETAIPQLRLTQCTQLTHLPVPLPVDRFFAEFGHLDDEVISFGELAGIHGIKGMPHLFSGIDGPFQLAPSCHMARRPAAELLEAATRFVDQALPEKYMAVHVRRGDYYNHCSDPMLNFNCWLSMAKLGSCIVEKLQAVEALGISTIYLATNGKPQEATFLQERVTALAGGKNITIVRLPQLKGADWAQPLREQWRESRQVPAEIEKIVCAMSTVFLRYMNSTYSREIARLRDGFHRSTCLDEWLCGLRTEEVPVL